MKVKKTKYQKKRFSLLLLTAAIALVISLIFVQPFSSQSITSEGPNTAGNPNSNRADMTSEKPALPVIGTKEKLHQLAKEIYDTEQGPWYKRIFPDMMNTTMEEATVGSTQGEVAFDTSAAVDFSATNIQVEGVDEADVLKTDGTYLYQIAQQQESELIVSKIFPVEDMKTIQRLAYQGDHFYPQELYLDQDFLVVIGHGYQEFNDKEPAHYHRKALAENEQLDIAILPHRGFTTTKAFVYDLSDVEAGLTLVRELEVEGHYLSSRKIDEHIYLVTNQYLTYRDPQTNKLLDEIPTPVYKDTAVSEDYVMLPYDQLYYFPDPELSTLNIAGFSLTQPEQALEISSFLGGGQEIYGNREHLYVTLTRYEPQEETTSSQARDMATSISWGGGAQSTDIYKFRWQDGKVEFLAEGNVLGRLLNQFSMDEYAGHLRLATTYGDMWREDELRSQNLVFILDEHLKTVGKIEDIAPGEQIYSARFMGERGYVVTFKTTDPLFVIDLQEPTAPKILGELKIPGFSNYLHPYDENHLIGFGQDTQEFVEQDSQGNSREFAIQKGIKMSLFDVSDPNKPKEKFVEIIGDSGTYSPLSYTHKALLFSKEKDIFAFPIQVMEAKPNTSHNPNPFRVPTEFTYQGAYVYGIDPEHGFQYKARISHLSNEQLQKDPWAHYQHFIERILYIEDTIYTVSSGKIQANDLHSFERLNTLDILYK